jgi:hypothetical protein
MILQRQLPSLIIVLCSIYGLLQYYSLDCAAAFTSISYRPACLGSDFNKCSSSEFAPWRNISSRRFVLQKEKSAIEGDAATTGTTATAKEGMVEAKERGSSDSNSDSAGLPWWWKYVWDLEMMKRGEPGTDIILGDSAHVLRTNIEQIYGGYPSLDGCPMATGEITDIAEGTMFIGLMRYNQNYGSPFKLCFGPKSFLTVSDPVQIKHILRDANTKYDKGILAEILKPIMGKGLIPADPETW